MLPEINPPKEIQQALELDALKAELEELNKISPNDVFIAEFGPVIDNLISVIDSYKEAIKTISTDSTDIIAELDAAVKEIKNALSNTNTDNYQ